MSLRVMPRRIAPVDGSWFQTSLSLGRIVRVFSKVDETPEIGLFLNGSFVPIWVCLNYSNKANGLRPVVRVGSMESPMLDGDSMYDAGLFKDPSFDSDQVYDYENARWLYLPWDEKNHDHDDATAFVCSECEQTLYKDRDGRRESHSACMNKDGEWICRNCQAAGPVYDNRTAALIEKMKRLAERIGGRTKERFDRDLEFLMNGFNPTLSTNDQTRICPDGEYSLNWSIRSMRSGKYGLNGGFILHQHPCEIRETEDGFEFDVALGKKVCRNATKEEISNIHWSIHT